MDGALIIDKPAGMTSHDVVARVRRIIGERRIGHTGTLDPFATGVLVLLVGRATRLAQFLTGLEKEYEAVFRLGYETDTADATGKRLPSEPRRPPGILAVEEFETALASLRGPIDQTPPMYSAKKIAGERLYELARRGEEVERKAVRVNVKIFEVALPCDFFSSFNDNGIADIRVRVVCSAGTYVRTLAQDLGRKLGVGAHVVELRRTRVGSFQIDGALSLDQLNELAESDSIGGVLISPDDTLSHLPAIDLDAEAASRVRNGIDLAFDKLVDWRDGAAVRLRASDRNLLAVGTFDAKAKSVHPAVVIAN